MIILRLDLMKLPCLICLTCKIFYSINQKNNSSCNGRKIWKENNRKMSNDQLVLGPSLFLFQIYEFCISLQVMERYPRGVSGKKYHNFHSSVCVRKGKGKVGDSGEFTTMFLEYLKSKIGQRVAVLSKVDCRSIKTNWLTSNKLYISKLFLTQSG